MDNKLPNVFRGNVGPLNNTQKVYYSSKDGDRKIDIENKKEEVFSNNRINVEEKINKIFNSPKFIYKMAVTITTKDGNMQRQIVGRNLKEVLTLDNERIPLTDIIDIQEL